MLLDRSTWAGRTQRSKRHTGTVLVSRQASQHFDSILPVIADPPTCWLQQKFEVGDSDLGQRDRCREIGLSSLVLLRGVGGAHLGPSRSPPASWCDASSPDAWKSVDCCQREERQHAGFKWVEEGLRHYQRETATGSFWGRVLLVLVRHYP